jgi:O-antigen ligase
VDMAGGLIFITPLLLGAYFVTSMPVLQLGMYGICLAAVLPHVGPFVGSLGRNPANLLLVLLFTALAMATGAAFGHVPSPEATLQAKALAATAVWASIYMVTFSSLNTSGDVLRLTRWLSSICLIVTASVYLSALFHVVGLRFGEILEFSDGTFRAFGPLGDQVGFLLVLPVLMSLVGSRPIMFGIHLGALLLTATRGAVLCVIVGMIAYLLLVATGSIRASRKRLRWSVAAVAVGGLVWLSPLSAVLMGRLSDPSLRLMAMEMGISAVQDRPLLGSGFNGFGNSRPAVAEDWFTPAQAENGLSRTMNQYIQTAADGGVVALAFLLLFVLSTSRNALRVIRWRSATPELVALQLWLIAVLAGNQGALWLLSNTSSGFFIFAVAGLAARASALAVSETAPRRRLA